jgi:hypothetical protein
MTDEIRYYDCGDCPLYGGCARVCARARELREPEPARRARDLFEAADLASAARQPGPEVGGVSPASGSDRRIAS